MMDQTEHNGKVGRVLSGLSVVLISLYLVFAQIYSSGLDYTPGEVACLSEVLEGSHFIDIPLDENERAMFSGGDVTKRLYKYNNKRFIFFRIDSGGNRKMLHNPRTCLIASGWQTTGQTEKIANQSSTVFTALDLTHLSDGRDAGCLFWYELGSNRHSSHFRFNLDYIMRKLTFGNSAATQSLILLQTVDASISDVSDLIGVADTLQNSQVNQSNRSS